MHVHLSAVAAVAETTNFATGHSDTSVVNQPVPSMDPLIAASLPCKRKSTKSTKGPAAKKARQGDEHAHTLPIVDLSEHLSTMDKAGETETTQEGSKQQEKESLNSANDCRFRYSCRKVLLIQVLIAVDPSGQVHNLRTQPLMVMNKRAMMNSTQLI